MDVLLARFVRFVMSRYVRWTCYLRDLSICSVTLRWYMDLLFARFLRFV